MTMKLIAAIAAAAALYGCEKVSVEQKLADLSFEKSRIHADLHRQQAECQAQAIEFSGDRKIVENCLATYEAMARISSKTIEAIGARESEILRTAGKPLLTDKEVFGR